MIRSERHIPIDASLALEPSVQCRLWSKVWKGPSCWLWMGSTLVSGHGQLTIKNRKYLAHRLSWATSNGTLPTHLDVCHRCDIPGCVNPDHLFVGTHSDNIRDSVAKKRHASAKKSICKRGHLFDETNTRPQKTKSGNPGRYCHACAMSRQRERRAKTQGAIT